MFQPKRRESQDEESCQEQRVDYPTVAFTSFCNPSFPSLRHHHDPLGFFVRDSRLPLSREEQKKKKNVRPNTRKLLPRDESNYFNGTKRELLEGK